MSASTASSALFHRGELLVQERAGVADVAARVGAANVLTRLNLDFAAFLADRFYVVAGAPGPDGSIWASVLNGRPGFASALDDAHVMLRAAPPDGDPLAEALGRGPVALGLLALDQATRGRIRLNGVATRVSDGVLVELREVFGNCPKHIGRRVPVAVHAPLGSGGGVRTGEWLDASQRALVTQADTVFVASAHADRGADASHRGGRPGFLEVAPGGDHLILPDYAGNRMFQTLGNLAVDPRIGLLVIDWQTGRTLQVTGRAQVAWGGADVAARPRAERLVRIDVEAVQDRSDGFPVQLELIEPSHLNPPLRAA